VPPCIARMSRAGPRTQGRPSSAQRSASQVPGEQACNADHDIRAEGLPCVEKRLGMGAHVFVHAHLTMGIEDAAVQPVHVQVDATVQRVRSRVESPRVSSLLRGMGRPLQDTG
jgi:hypothetical protein